MAHSLVSAKYPDESVPHSNPVKLTAGVYSNCEDKVCEFEVDAVADFADLPTCLPGSWAWDHDLALMEQLKPNSHWDLPAATPVLFTVDPASVSVVAGSISGALTATSYSKDEAAITYQWYSNNSEDYTSPSAIGGATSASYTIPTDLTEGTYYYFRDDTSSAVTVHSGIAVVTVTAAP